MFGGGRRRRDTAGLERVEERVDAAGGGVGARPRRKCLCLLLEDGAHLGCGVEDDARALGLGIRYVDDLTFDGDTEQLDDQTITELKSPVGYEEDAVRSEIRDLCVERAPVGPIHFGRWHSLIRIMSSLEVDLNGSKRARL